MRFTLIINQAPPREAPHTAYQFATALLAKNHQLECVFFQRDGVLIHCDSTKLPQDELNLQKAWLQLANAHQFPLDICSASALRRGVISKENNPSPLLRGEREKVNKYRISGLAQLFAAISHSDRVITFG